MSRYTDREREVYTSPLPGSPKFDPLSLQRKFWAATRGRWHDLLREVDAAAPVTRDTTGDISRGPESYVTAAVAEETLADAARSAFGLPGWPDGPTDGVVLDAMSHFLGWLEGND